MSDRRRQTRDDTERARELRSLQTNPEQTLWTVLRNRALAGLKSRRQLPIGSYFADFACAEANLIVELDGESHEGRREYDAERTAFLESRGYKVFRITNDDVLNDLEAVAIGIARAAGIDVEAWLSGKWKPNK